MFFTLKYKVAVLTFYQEKRKEKNVLDFERSSFIMRHAQGKVPLLYDPLQLAFGV